MVVDPRRPVLPPHVRKTSSEPFETAIERGVRPAADADPDVVVEIVGAAGNEEGAVGLGKQASGESLAVDRQVEPAEPDQSGLGPAPAQFGLLLDEGIQDGKVLKERLFEPVSAERLRQEFKDEIVTANKVTKPSDEAVEELADLLRKNTETCHAYLTELAENYRFLITLKDADKSLEIRKTGLNMFVETLPISNVRVADYDIEFCSRYSYVRRALTQLYGNEVIFVGSGGIFKYRDPARARQNIHRELVMLLRVHEDAPRSRFGDQSKFLYLIKTGIKALLGRLDTDIYDLSHWIADGT